MGGQRNLTHRERTWFKVGTAVRVKGHEREGVRRVVAVYADIAGGRLLNTPVDGFVSWNVADLRKA